MILAVQFEDRFQFLQDIFRYVKIFQTGKTIGLQILQHLNGGRTEQRIPGGGWPAVQAGDAAPLADKYGRALTGVGPVAKAAFPDINRIPAQSHDSDLENKRQAVLVLTAGQALQRLF